MQCSSSDKASGHYRTLRHHLSTSRLVRKINGAISRMTHPTVGKKGTEWAGSSVHANAQTFLLHLREREERVHLGHPVPFEEIINGKHRQNGRQFQHVQYQLALLDHTVCLRKDGRILN